MLQSGQNSNITGCTFPSAVVENRRLFKAEAEVSIQPANFLTDLLPIGGQPLRRDLRVLRQRCAGEPNKRKVRGCHRMPWPRPLRPFDSSLRKAALAAFPLTHGVIQCDIDSWKSTLPPRDLPPSVWRSSQVDISRLFKTWGVFRSSVMVCATRRCPLMAQNDIRLLIAWKH